jgi:uncharacterized protein
MLQVGSALKVTVYLNEDTGSASGFLHQDILRFLLEHDIEGATAFRAVAGFGVHRRLHTSGVGDVAGLHIPMILSFVDAAEKIRGILPQLLAMVRDGLVEAHPTEVLKNVTTVEKVIS